MKVHLVGVRSVRTLYLCENGLRSEYKIHTGEKLLIARNPQADIRIKDPTISRHGWEIEYSRPTISAWHRLCHHVPEYKLGAATILYPHGRSLWRFIPPALPAVFIGIGLAIADPWGPGKPLEMLFTRPISTLSALRPQISSFRLPVAGEPPLENHQYLCMQQFGKVQKLCWSQLNRRLTPLEREARRFAQLGYPDTAAHLRQRIRHLDRSGATQVGRSALTLAGQGYTE